MIFDMTSKKYALESILEYFRYTKTIDEKAIFEYIYMEEPHVENFMQINDIKNEDLMEKDLSLAMLHSTTSIDNCKSIKTFGLMSLRNTLNSNTSLTNFLKSKEIYIDINKKNLIYKGELYDLNKSESNIYFHSEPEISRNMVIHKLYNDFQINGFLYSSDLTDYDGYTRERPEFLYNLADLLNAPHIEKDWTNHPKNKHFIIKSNQPLHHYRFWTFQVESDDSLYGITEDQLKYLSKFEVEVKVRKWLIQNAFDILKNNVSDLYAYMHPRIKIRPENITEILSEEDYLYEYAENKKRL